MKRLTVLCLSLLLALSLCACGGDTPAEETTDPATESATTETQPEAAPEAETTPESKPDGKTEGKYACTAIAFGEDVLDGGDNWLDLKSGGKATLFLGSMIVCWSGLSVHMQVAGFLNDAGLSVKKHLKAHLLLAPAVSTVTVLLAGVFGLL